jgi:plastocyanin
MRLTGLVAVMALGLVACSEDTAGPGGPGFVTVANNFFSPTSTNPDTSGAVVFQWSAGGVAHTVTWEDLAPGSGQRTTGQYVRDFSGATPGPYRYRCENHSSTFGALMSGQIVVP